MNKKELIACGWVYMGINTLGWQIWKKGNWRRLYNPLLDKVKKTYLIKPKIYGCTILQKTDD